MKKQWYLLLLLACTAMAAEAKVKIAQVFSDHMVLQQGKNITVWGTAEPGERISVKIGGRSGKATTDAQGYWQTVLAPLKATAKPLEMTVKGDRGKTVLRDILVGEVWLASGQSNMEYSMNNHPRYRKPKKGDPERLFREFTAAKNPLIRIMNIKKDLKADSLPTDGWQRLGEESLRPFSAPAYFFAKNLHDSLQVPVGIIASAWGGTAIETWTPLEAYRQSEQLKEHLNGDRYGTEPVGNRYDKMIAPMAPFALKGFLWYQGETNLINGDGATYAEKFRTLVGSWRKAWQDDGLPFYYVQLSPMRYSARKTDAVAHSWIDLPRFWDVQAEGMAIPNTGMAVTTDIPDDLGDIHPSYKWIVGERLARWALNRTYGQNNVVCSGPVMQSVSEENGKIIVTFGNTGAQLATRDGKAPDWFYVKRPDHRFERVKAEIAGNTVILSPTRIGHPLVVRFGYDETAQPNLINPEGLPALPFEYRQ
jgi:sialate O-acetylesterase